MAASSEVVLSGADPRRIDAIAGRRGPDVAGIGSRPFVRLSGSVKQKLLIAIAVVPAIRTSTGVE